MKAQVTQPLSFHLYASAAKLMYTIAQQSVNQEGFNTIAVKYFISVTNNV
jgi:hypothetical protein